MRFIIQSILIHIFIIFSVILVKDKQKSTKPIVVQIIQQNFGLGQTEILELSNNGHKKAKNFYWGIGIYQDFVCKEINKIESKCGYLVTEVSNSYTASAAGIKTGDFIFQIDGIDIDEITNDIRGDGPKSLNLKILRNGSIISIKVNRTKIYN